MNAIHETDQYASSEGNGTFLTQEHALKSVVTLPGKPVGKGFVESRDWLIFFLDNNEIGYVNLKTQKYHTIYSGGCFNFSTCELIDPDFAFRSGCNELVMYFSSNCVYYRMNIDELLRGTGYCEKCGEQVDDCCEHFEIMKEVKIPKITVERLKGGGSGAPGGSYSFTCRYIDENGNSSNYFVPSKPIPLIGKDGDPGQPSNNSIKAHFEHLDDNYSYLEVVLIRKIGGVPSYYVLGEYPYNSQGVTVHYSGQDPDRTITPNEIFVPKKKYLRGRKLIIRDSRLYFYQIRQEKDVNIFKYTSQIQTRWKAFAVNAEEAENYMSMERGAVVRLGAWLNYADGTRSWAGQIPAGGASVASGGEDAWNQNNQYSFWEDENAQRIFQNLNTSGSSRNDRRSSPSDIVPGNETEGSAPSPGGSSSFSASFSKNKKPLVNKDINNNFMGKDAYDRGEEIEKRSLEQRLADFQANAPSRYAEGCSCVECGPDQCVEAMELWESQEKNIYDHETNTGWHTRNKINPDPTTHPEIESENQATGNIKAAGENVHRNALNVEDKEYGARKINISGKTVQAGIASKGSNNQSRDRAAQREVGGAVEIASGNTRIKKSTIKYPAIKDCNGQDVYGGLACEHIRDHQMPWGEEIPIVVSAADGVVNRYQLENKEKGDTHVILLGLEFSNIKLPPDDELPKPLNKNNPISFGMVMRDGSNNNILAKGIANGLYEGEAQGKTYLFERNGLNAGEFINRAISSGPEQSRLGSGSSDAGFMFHSPTTDILGPILDASKVHIENNVGGAGARLGLYAETNTHSTGFWEPIIDNRGYRAAINLNKFSSAGGDVDINGITYAPADSVVTPVGGLSTPLCHRYRERAVFVAGSIGTPIDASWQGDTVDHYCLITNVQGQYVALHKEILDQYGSVESSSYIPLGIEGTGGSSTASGTCGDVFISFYTKQKKVYISDKNGNDLTVDKDLWNSARLNLGMADFWKLPEDGNAEGEDVRDPKSVAGTQGPKRCSPGEVTSSQYDVYLPSVATTNLMFWCESKVNSDWRQVGDEQLGEVWYGNLKTLEYDSDTPKQQDWRNCWMNRFYAEHMRPSKGQLIARVIVRFMVVYWMLNFFITSDAATINGTLDAGALMVRGGAVSAFLPVIQRLLFNNRMLNRMLGIKEWYTDDSEGNLDEYVKGFEDIYGEYNLDYSEVYSGVSVPSMNKWFYDCHCDNCELGETTNEIYYTRKQLQGQRIDSFSQVDVNSYLEIPADYGKLQRMYVINGGLFAHTTDTILTLRYGKSVTDVNLGESLYDTPLSFSEGIPEGNWGTMDPNAGVLSKWGLFFPDREHRSWNLFNGQDVKEISADGLKNFWKEHMDFCQPGCVDQQHHGIFYTVGIDHRHNRLLITKNVNDDPKDSFTLSYDLNRGVWRSFHSYIPNMYGWNRKNMYSIKGNKMYMHDNNRGVYLKGYDGENVPFIVEFNAVSPTYFEYKDTKLDTEANLPLEGQGWVYNQKSTFNKAILFNRTQCSGLLNLSTLETSDMDLYNTQDPANIIMGREGEEWRFNQVGDYLIDPEQPIFIGDSCSPYTWLNESNIDQSKYATDGDFRHEILADKNIAYRLIYDNEDSHKYQLYLRQVLTYVNFPIQ